VTESDADLGEVEAAVRAVVAELGELDGVQPALAAAAYMLARQLDSGAGMATAAVARELRETLRALTEASDADDVASRLAAELSAPVGYAEEPEQVDAGAAAGAGVDDDRPPADAVARPRRGRRAGG
jgi:hypothetical protein